MGPTHVNALLSSLNIPTLCVSTLKAREREIGPAIENIANKSCDLEMEEEKMEWGCIQEKAVPIGASYDMGWQKRGKGHNSLTGTENNLQRLLTVSGNAVEKWLHCDTTKNYIPKLYC